MHQGNLCLYSSWNRNRNCFPKSWFCHNLWFWIDDNRWVWYECVFMAWCFVPNWLGGVNPDEPSKFQINQGCHMWDVCEMLLWHHLLWWLPGLKLFPSMSGKTRKKIQRRTRKRKHPQKPVVEAMVDDILNTFRWWWACGAMQRTIFYMCIYNNCTIYYIYIII